MAQRLRPADLLAVWVGGTIGTAARVALTPARSLTAFPVATFLINVVGAALLGLLLERLAHQPVTRRIRLFGLLTGTGVLGGFTTYSALAVDTVQLGRNGAILTAIAYAVGTLVTGAAASWLGIALGRIRRGRR